MSFEGFGAVLVQSSRFDSDEAETAEFLSMAFGLVATVIILATAPVWAKPLFGSDTSDLIQLASPAFVLASIGVVSRARLQRRLDFQRISIFEVVAAMCGYVVSVTAAIGGLGAEALIAGALTLVGAEAILMCWAEHPARPRLHGPCIRRIASFGISASFASLSWIARRNIDYIILSARLPAAQVGYYWRAFLLGAEYQDKIGGVTSRLAFPLFSRSRSAEDVRLLRSRLVRVNVSVVFPLLATLIVTAPTLVPWLYGQRWEAAVVPAQILAVGGMSLAVMSGTEMLILAMGRPRILLALNLSFLIATGLAVLVASSHGLSTVCIAVAGVQIVMVAVAQLGILSRLTAVRAADLLSDVLPAAAASLVALAAGAITAHVVSIPHSPFAEVAIVSIVSLAVYLVVFRALFGSAWSEISRTARRVARRTTG